MNPMYIKHLVKEIFPPIQNTVLICEQITILILDNINSRLVPFLKLIYASVQINIFVFILSFKLINFIFQRFSFLIPKSSTGLRLKFCRLSPLIWLGFCNNFNLAYFCWSINFEY
jgi:hypothetical protein